jgi:short-chain Z-isoprenyl diphosphate synthase
MDGNRRWARQMGMEDPSLGHRYDAEHVDRVLGRCRELGDDDVTVYVRPSTACASATPPSLLDVIESATLTTLVGDRLRHGRTMVPAERPLRARRHGCGHAVGLRCR